MSTYKKKGGFHRVNAICPRNHDRIVQMASDGMILTHIAKEIGANPRHVKEYIIRKQIPFEFARPACAKHSEKIVEMLNAGKSLSSIAVEIGTKPCCVRKYIVDNQIQYTFQKSAGPNNHAWKGGRILDKHGYVLLHQPDHPFANSGGYVREHRLVMEKRLGRYLTREEVVHHRDDSVEGRQNNSDENLTLYATNGDHLRETLAGKVPAWTPDGKSRILAACRASGDKRRGITPNWSPEAKARILQAARGPKKRKAPSNHPLLETDARM